MGVRGLTTFIDCDSELYLKPYELHDCQLVLDGKSALYNLFSSSMKSRCAFGGDYDEYYNAVKNFFLMLRKCKVTPIVIFDGGYEKKKTKTILNRSQSRVLTLREFSRGFSNTMFYPLFLNDVFFDVINDLKIFCVRTDLEADTEIAAIARALKCPVLSNDSDFYIFDVLYIPFSTLRLTANQFPDSSNYYLKCSLYEVKNLLYHYQGLDKSLLPIMAILLGNDYIESSTFQKFYNHVSIKEAKHKSYTQRRIQSVLHWLKTETVESATKLILSHLQKNMENKVLQAIQSSIDDYTSTSVSQSVFDKLPSDVRDELKKRDFCLKLPPETLKSYYNCKINPIFLDIITLGKYYTFVQVEGIQQSSHVISLELIKNIYKILSPYVLEKVDSLTIYLAVQNHYSGVRVKPADATFSDEISLEGIIKEPKKVRLKWLCKIVGIDEEDIKILPCSNWSIFIMSFLYWRRKLSSLLSAAHLHALILMVIANEIVQKDVGYFRNYTKFMKSKGELIRKINTKPIPAGNGGDFDEMLGNISVDEKLLAQSELIPYRQTLHTGKDYHISTVHLFSCFQSCLFHILHINSLLNFPLPHLRVGDFYSGTLLYNFWMMIKSKPQVVMFGCGLFKQTPNLAIIYKYLCETLNLGFETALTPAVKKKRSGKRRKQVCVKREMISLKPSIEDNEEYYDTDNLYSLLQNLSCN